MIVETIVDEPSTLKTAQTANALIPMEVGAGQLDIKQQLGQQFNQLRIKST